MQEAPEIVNEMHMHINCCCVWVSIFVLVSLVLCAYNAVFGCAICIYKLLYFLVPNVANMRKTESDNDSGKRKSKALPVNSVHMCIQQ